MKIGKATFSRSGKYEMPPQFIKLFGTLLLFSVPIPVTYALQYYTLRSTYIIYIIYVVYSLVYIVTIYTVIRTGITEPGVIPPYSFFANFVQNLAETFTQRQGDVQVAFNNQPLYQVLNYQPEDKFLLQTHRLGKNHYFRYCKECNIYKPMRAAHSSRYNCCVMRFDHFCPFVGNDIAMFNYASFYSMVKTILVFLSFTTIYFVLVLCITIYQMIHCLPDGDTYSALCPQNDENTRVGIGIYVGSIVACVIVLSITVYYVYAVNQLFCIHRTMLKTGTLMREYMGSQKANLEVSYMYSLLDSAANKKDVMYMAKNRFKILKNTLSFVNTVTRLVKSDKSISDFDQLLGKLKKETKIYNPSLQFVMEYQWMFIVLDRESSLANYKMQFIQEDNDELREFFQTLTQSIQHNVNDVMEYKEKYGQQQWLDSQVLEIQTKVLTYFLIYMSNRIPFYVYRNLEKMDEKILKLKDAELPIICCNALVTSLVAVYIGTMMLRTSAEDYEQYKKENPLLFSQQDSEFELELAKKCSCKREKLDLTNNTRHFEVVTASKSKR